MDDVTQSKGKSAQVRLRATAAEKERLEGQALEAGFRKKDGSANLSEYLRKMLLESHALVVRPGEDLLLIPGAFTTAEGQADVENVVRRVLDGLNSKTPAPAGSPPDQAATPGDPPASPPAAAPAPEVPPAEALAQVADATPQPSPAEDAVVGTGASQTPPGEIPPPAPPADTFCSNCGNYFPTGTHQPGGDACNELRRARLARQQQAAEVPVESPEAVDTAALTPEELEPDPHPPLGPPQPGESEVEFMGRRVVELRRDGRPSTLARAEAGAEWRRATGGAVHPLEQPAPPAAAPAPGLIPPQPPAPAHRVCGGCGATVAAGHPCPECGSTI